MSAKSFFGQSCPGCENVQHAYTRFAGRGSSSKWNSAVFLPLYARLLLFRCFIHHFQQCVLRTKEDIADMWFHADIPLFAGRSRKPTAAYHAQVGFGLGSCRVDMPAAPCFALRQAGWSGQYTASWRARDSAAPRHLPGRCQRRPWTNARLWSVWLQYTLSKWRRYRQRRSSTNQYGTLEHWMSLEMGPKYLACNMQPVTCTQPAPRRSDSLEDPWIAQVEQEWYRRRHYRPS